MPDRYPGYDVLSKRDTPSWNEQTRRVIDARLSVPDQPAFLNAREWLTLKAVCERIVPQPAVPQTAGRPPVPTAALVDCKLQANAGDGYRNAKLPPLREAWRQGLQALEREALDAYGRTFYALDT